MDKQSLLDTYDALVDYISKHPTMSTTDKTELLINLHYFLKPEDYENNINVLMKDQQAKRLSLKLKHCYNFEEGK